MSTQSYTQGQTATQQPRELYYELGRALLVRRRHAEAVAALQSALNEEGDAPPAFDVHVALHEAYTEAGEKARAFITFLAALAHVPDLSEEQIDHAHRLLPSSLDKDDQKWIQEKWGPKMLESAQSDAARFGLSTLVGRVGLYGQDYTSAHELFLDATRIKPDDPRGWEGLGDTLWKMGRMAEARAALSEAYGLAEQSPEAGRLRYINSKLARVLAELGDYGAALERVEHIDTEDTADAYLMLITRSHCRLALGMPAKALDDAEEAARLQPKGVQSHLKRAQALTALKKYADAINVADHALQFAPTSGAVILSKAQALIEGQIDLEQARRLLTRLKSRAGDYEAMSQFLSPAVDHGELGGDTHFFLAHLNHVLGRREEALREVNRALELGLSGDKTEPAAPAFQLKGELLLDDGDAEQGVAQLVEAGRLFTLRGDYAAAGRLFETASSVSPGEQQIYWYWSDAVRMGSSMQEYPYKDKAAVEKALDLWKKGFALGPPTKEFAWAYLVPSLLLESLAVFTERQRPLYAEALTYAERSVLLDPTNENVWTYLSRLARVLFMDANSLIAIEQSLALAPEDTQARIERFVLAVTVGEEGAVELIEENRERFSSFAEWAALIEAYLLSNQDRHDEALGKLGGVTDESVNDPDLRNLRGQILRRAGRWKEAQEDYKWIWEITAPGTPMDLPGNLLVRAWAGLLLGHYEEAEKIYRALPEDGGQDNYDVHINLLFTLLGRGRLEEARAEFGLALPMLRTRRQLSETLQDLKYFERVLAERPEREAVQGLIQTCVQELERARPRVESKSYDLEAAETELLEMSEAGEQAEMQRRAAQLGLARVRVNLGKFDEAIAVYRALLRAAPPVPEAEHGLRTVREKLTAAGDQILEKGDHAGALNLFERALDLVANTPSGADIHARIGLMRAALADPEAARPDFDRALHLYREAGTQAPGEALGATCRPLVRNTEEYWRLDDAWRSWASADEETGRDYSEARKSLSGYLNRAYQLQELDGDAYALVEPLGVYMGMALTNLVAEQESDLVNVYTKEMRARIERDRGVTVPSVRYTDTTELGDERYLIRLNELAVGSDSVQLGMRFSPEAPEKLRAAGLGEDSMVEAVNYATADPGAWVKPEHWQSVEERGLELWPSPLHYMVTHLEALLRHNLKEFVGVQEVENMLAALRRDEELLPLVTEVLPDHASALRFGRVLRELVRENVPVNGLAEILRAARTTELAQGNFIEILRGVRLQIKGVLPGNTGAAATVNIPDAFEARVAGYLHEEGGEKTLTVPVVEVSELFGSLEALLAAEGRSQTSTDELAFVVADPHMRFHLSHLFAVAGIDISVMSREELLP
ncbi:MAG TPA: FHIPEP family type III secretion protein [Pyrinomonadaceae bacterium]|jgi:tetratricopeptide (TPR) repeat protein